MKINIITIFPNLIKEFIDTAIFKRAQEKKILSINICDLRDYSNNKHRSVDDYSYGGKPGMVLQAEPFFNYFKENSVKNVVFVSPQGTTLNRSISKELSELDELTIICGHYEGIDDRVIEKHVDIEISLGDYVLSGGELPSLVLIDSIIRFIPNFIDKDSVSNDSFEKPLLDHGVYTRPKNICDLLVPSELISGNHSLIDKYRKLDSIYRTMLKRRDLLKKLDDKDKEIVRYICEDILKDLK
jgi:tRNA (guanine37-N1)-methyltransferase